MKPKLFVILGPTASGKSALAVQLAKQFGGEVVSADSRQIYRELDIGTGKVPRDPTNDLGRRTNDYLHAGVRHHLLDVAEPNEYFSVADYKKHADVIVADIARRGMLPILAGGTGQYIQAIVDNVVPPEVPPHKELRRELAKNTPEELFTELKRLDPLRAKTIEQENPRRLIRAIEIARALGEVPQIDTGFPPGYSASPYDTLQIGIDTPLEILTERIQSRVRERLENGWVSEVGNLLVRGITPERMEEIGLGYTIIGEYLRTKIPQSTPSKTYSNVLKNIGIGLTSNAKELEGLVDRITTAERRYAKRQMRWFKRDKRIRWFTTGQEQEIFRDTQKFLFT